MQLCVIVLTEPGIGQLKALCAAGTLLVGSHQVCFVDLTEPVVGLHTSDTVCTQRQ